MNIGHFGATAVIRGLIGLEHRLCESQATFMARGRKQTLNDDVYLGREELLKALGLTLSKASFHWWVNEVDPTGSTAGRLI